MAVQGSGNFVDVMICLIPIKDASSELNYILVLLLWNMTIFTSEDKKNL